MAVTNGIILRRCDSGRFESRSEITVRYRWFVHSRVVDTEERVSAIRSESDGPSPQTFPAYAQGEVGSTHYLVRLRVGVG